jgi:uncharacterized heparinase superfamily protein
MNRLLGSVVPETLYAGVHTLARMQHEQLLGIGLRTSREQLLPRLPVDFDQWYERQIPSSLSVDPEPVATNTALLRESLAEATRDRYRRRATEAAAGAPTFMNRTLRIAEGTAVEWFDPQLDDQPMLWRLKLYGFQPLTWLTLGFDPPAEEAAPSLANPEPRRTDGAGTAMPERSDLQSTFDDWIGDWIDSISLGAPGYLRGTWTPWAVSLRLLAWCRYLAWRDTGMTGVDTDFEPRLRRACYRNALFLRKHVEWDVGGNHLVENGAALVAAGVLFDEEPWIDHGTTVLTEAAATQFLDDGCHFERSPMYHVLTLTRFLTVCHLLEAAGRPVPDELCRTAHEAAAYLRYLRPSNGRLPLLNDAVRGQSLPLDDCLRYAGAVGVDTGSDAGADGTDWSDPVNGASPIDASGYHWLSTEAGELLFDGGPVGPPHLPGHSHSDTLGILLWLDGQQILTDTGTLGYVSDTDRRYARGVRGHNTVQVGDCEPISLGGKYLMGPRPTPTTRVADGHVSLCEGIYEAAPYRGPAYTHHRAVYAGDDWWLVRDTVDDHGGKPVRSRLQLHPDVEPSMADSARVELSVSDTSAWCVPLDTAGVSVTAGRYFPRFGVTENRRVVELRASNGGHGPRSVGVLVTTRDRPVVDVETPTGTQSSLSLDGEHHTLPATHLDPPAE